MGFNSAFKGLKSKSLKVKTQLYTFILNYYVFVEGKVVLLGDVLIPI
jgi:hypothetical protein